MGQAMAASEDITVLGKVTTAFGIKGWVKLYSYTDPITNLLDYDNLLLKSGGEWRKVEIEDGQTQGKGLVAKLKGVSDRNAALALSQCEIGVLTSALPEPGEDEHYWFQLEGLRVINTHGQLLGQVKELFESGGGNVVMSVSSCEGSIDRQGRLLPYVDAIVLDVDLDSGEIQVQWDADY
jgi:16S rRNA processing protein RimM